MSEKSPKYTPEFKQTIVNLYYSGKTYNQIKDTVYHTTPWRIGSSNIPK